MSSGNSASRYDTDVDLDIETSHTKILRLVGMRQRVLDVGCATGQMARVLKERGCQVVGIEADPEAAKLAEEHCDAVIVGDIESLDLAVELGERRFDVIVAGDVLEHLKEPEAALRSLRPFLDPNGYLVTSVPNVAHGSVRLALLTGSFPYAELGLLDRTHLRFYTRASLNQMLESAEFTPVHSEDLELPIENSEVPFPTDGLPPGVLDDLGEQADARVYQFVVVAFPSRGARGPVPQLLKRLSDRARVLEPMETEVMVLRGAVDELRDTFQDMHLRLLESNDRLVRTEGETTRLRSLTEQLSTAVGQKDERIAHLESQVDALRRVEDELREVHRSKLWRIATAYRTIFGALRSARNGDAG